MTRLERFHEKTSHVHLKGHILFLFICIILLSGLLVFKHYNQETTPVETPNDNLGKKVVVHLPDGNVVYTYEKYIVKKKGKTYYKGDRNTIDLTGGTITYKNWK